LIDDTMLLSLAIIKFCLINVLWLEFKCSAWTISRCSLGWSHFSVKDNSMFPALRNSASSHHSLVKVRFILCGIVWITFMARKIFEIIE